jgi:hypothetical protein
MKYGKGSISRGASTARTTAMTVVTFANLRGTVRIRSVCDGKDRGHKEWQSKRNVPLCAKLRQSAIHSNLVARQSTKHKFHEIVSDSDALVETLAFKELINCAIRSVEGNQSGSGG